MRVVTWNAQHGVAEVRRPPDLGAALGPLGDLGADIVAVQELDRGRRRSARVDQPAAVAAALDGELVWGPALQRGGPYGVALVVRGTVLDSELQRLPGRGEPRVVVLAQVEVAGRRWSIGATHLSTRGSVAVPQLLGVLDALGRLPGPRVLLGDLNLEPAELLPWTTAEGYRLVVGAPTHSTRDAAPTRRIDHIAVQGDVALGPSAVHLLPVSDHLAVVVDLRAT